MDIAAVNDTKQNTNNFIALFYLMFQYCAVYRNVKLNNKRRATETHKKYGNVCFTLYSYKGDVLKKNGRFFFMSKSESLFSHCNLKVNNYFTNIMSLKYFFSMSKMLVVNKGKRKYFIV